MPASSFSSLSVVAKSGESCSIFGRRIARSARKSARAADSFSRFLLVCFTSLLCSLLFFAFILLIFHSAQMCAITRAPRALRFAWVPRRGSSCTRYVFSRFISLFFRALFIHTFINESRCANVIRTSLGVPRPSLGVLELAQGRNMRPFASSKISVPVRARGPSEPRASYPGAPSNIAHLFSLASCEYFVT